MKKVSVELKIGLFIMLFVCVTSIVSLFYTPWDAYEMNVNSTFTPPSWDYLFGADNLGRDVLSRTMIGIRYSLLISLTTVILCSVIGVSIGLISANSHKIVDQVIIRIIDAINSIPIILLALVLMGVFSTNLITLILAMSIVFTPSFVRISRNESLQIRQLEYIQHAYLLGANKLRIMYNHILPNLAPSLLSAIIIAMTNAVLAESVLSYLGLGIQPPIPSLGRMMFEGQAYLFNAPWGTIMPGGMIMIIVLGLNFIGEGVRKDFTY